MAISRWDLWVTPWLLRRQISTQFYCHTMEGGLVKMNVQIEIDQLMLLENRYKEILEGGTEPYPTLSDFDVKTPLEILEKYPILPCLLTSFKLDRQKDVTPFLKLQKPTANLPEYEQKELIRYIIELTVDFVPIYGMVKNLTGTNAHARTGPIHNGIGFYIKDIGNTLIKQLELGFTEEDIDACPNCGDPKCSPRYNPICDRCHHVISKCEKEYVNHYNGETTCNFCGEQHALCLEHVRKPKDKTCAVYARKRPDSEKYREIATVEKRRLLQRLKREFRDILKEIHHQFPTLVDFHTRHPGTFLKQYPIVPATLTVLKESETNPMLFHQMRSDAKVAGLKLISAIRDITAAEWGDTLADTSTNALIECFKLKLTLNEINTCQKCGDPTCAGSGGGFHGFCDNTMDELGLVVGCGEVYFPCDTRHDTILTCDNPLCRRPNYRRCTEHTCDIADHTGFVHYLIELEQGGNLTPNVHIFVNRINALPTEQQADFVKQFHDAVKKIKPIENTVETVKKTLHQNGLETIF